MYLLTRFYLWKAVTPRQAWSTGMSAFHVECGRP